MKVFVVIPKTYAGCGYYRQYMPHSNLSKIDGVECTYSDGTFKDDELAVDADIIHFHKNYFSVPAALMCKRDGIKVIVDYDDYWFLDTEHIFYQNYVKEGSSKQLIEILRLADAVTVTTELLAIEARKFNNNVCVIPNAFDPDSTWPNERVKEPKIVFGYMGGHCHGKDVEQLRGVNNRLSQEFNNYKFRLFGYDRSPPYNHYASVLSGSGHQAGQYFDWIEQANIWDYHKFYNHLDVGLIPLVNNKFNRLKSELKLIEAGFYKKPVIVDNVHPYRDLIKHKQNAMVVNKYSDWYKHCKYLLNNPDARIELGEALYETVQPYHIKEVTKKRLKFYEDVHKSNNTNGSDRHSGVSGINKLRLHSDAVISEIV